jgi:hypothetical protein
MFLKPAEHHAGLNVVTYAAFAGSNAALIGFLKEIQLFVHRCAVLIRTGRVLLRLLTERS